MQVDFKFGRKINDGFARPESFESGGFLGGTKWTGSGMPGQQVPNNGTADMVKAVALFTGIGIALLSMVGLFTVGLIWGK